ncbi:MAG: transcriptional repressor [Candidatus Marinimicrobia bacterium]|jgi:Fur family ferric uptake transcriptional regulator|nr:transcriptional repressor [Candidatus Neomarinimicrobiota bacterium]MBT3796192.1 transcriptional repressor [Candidatus Neomarinimicrobiota bacterium]MBT4148996.1 transcriptional repressor [Candidatus Neomarinimicrobiota bacterium]MBT4318697.1 transcriptional repressor [Candidatus Neomarinimicrobiota bacterium]MBT4784695.1 transcriptional repressor [Candidatus Neomarinimicrobiota bacterium]|tara:strand:+ start:1588 stop:2010 length:423 start_codon:yes stop_codon:yes gene_type:complete
MTESNLLKKALKKEGLRYTQQRQLIWDELCSSEEHRDAEEIYLSLRKEGVNASRATVYRTIDVLVKNKLVRKLDLGDGKARYENKIDSTHHDHLICVKCGKIEEFMNDKIEAIQDDIVKSLGFKMIRHIHQLFVLCDKCQ